MKHPAKRCSVLALGCVAVLCGQQVGFKPAGVAGVLYFQHARLAKATPASSSAEVRGAEVRGPEPKSRAAPEKTVTVDKLLADYKSSAVNAARENRRCRRSSRHRPVAERRVVCQASADVHAGCSLV